MGELLLREVTCENWRAALQLAVLPEQQRFISEHTPIVAIALAKAYIRPNGLTWTPFAFYHAEEMIGFTAFSYESHSQQNYWLYHFFIDYRYQGRGYGKQALQAFLQFIQAQYLQCEAVQLTVHPQNYRAQSLYRNGGFRPTGFELEGEPVYKFTFST